MVSKFSFLLLLALLSACPQGLSAIDKKDAVFLDLVEK